MPDAAVLPEIFRDRLPLIIAAIPAHLAGTVANADTNMRHALAGMITAFTYAPEAPIEILTEAAIRIAAYTAAAPPHLAARKITVPDGSAIESTYRASMSPSPLRHSGASGLLGPYRAVRGFEGF